MAGDIDRTIDRNELHTRRPLPWLRTHLPFKSDCNLTRTRTAIKWSLDCSDRRLQGCSHRVGNLNPELFHICHDLHLKASLVIFSKIRYIDLFLIKDNLIVKTFLDNFETTRFCLAIDKDRTLTRLFVRPQKSGIYDDLAISRTSSICR